MSSAVTEGTQSSLVSIVGVEKGLCEHASVLGTGVLQRNMAENISYADRQLVKASLSKNISHSGQGKCTATFL